jgi:predicted nucleic acid-binding protein
MANHFPDTSAFIKYYHAEAGSAEVARLWAEPTARPFISRLRVVETVSFFAKKTRSSLITATDFGLLRKCFFADIRRRRPAVVRLLARHAQEALRLLQQYSLAHSLHALDVLQLAVALDLRSRGLLDVFVVADRVLVTVDDPPKAGRPTLIGQTDRTLGFVNQRAISCAAAGPRRSPEEEKRDAVDGCYTRHHALKLMACCIFRLNNPDALDSTRSPCHSTLRRIRFDSGKEPRGNPGVFSSPLAGPNNNNKRW